MSVELSSTGALTRKALSVSAFVTALVVRGIVFAIDCSFDYMKTATNTLSSNCCNDLILWCPSDLSVVDIREADWPAVAGSEVALSSHVGEDNLTAWVLSRGFRKKVKESFDLSLEGRVEVGTRLALRGCAFLYLLAQLYYTYALHSLLTLYRDVRYTLLIGKGDQPNDDLQNGHGHHN